MYLVMTFHNRFSIVKLKADVKSYCNCYFTAGDINFARDLSDLRHRNNLRVILVHRDEASEALKACANQTIAYQDIVHELPFRSPAKVNNLFVL